MFVLHKCYYIHYKQYYFVFYGDELNGYYKHFTKHNFKIFSKTFNKYKTKTNINCL